MFAQWAAGPARPSVNPGTRFFRPHAAPFCPAIVPREFPESAQAAGRGVKQMRNSAGLAAPGESVVREFLQS
jgi:hypothetical protein